MPLFAEGKRHDAGMLIDSNLLQELERNAFSPTGQPMSVYGDPAYPLRIHLQAPFRQGVLTPMMEQYNSDMSSVRVTVEWLFGDIINDFKFLDFKNEQCGKNVPCLCSTSQCINLFIWKQHLRVFWSRPPFIAVLF